MIKTTLEVYYRTEGKNIDEWLVIYIINISLLECLNIDYAFKKNQQYYRVSFMVLQMYYTFRILFCC